MPQLYIFSLIASALVALVLSNLLFRSVTQINSTTSDRRGFVFKWILILSFSFAPYRLFSLAHERSLEDSLYWHWLPLFGFIALHTPFGGWGRQIIQLLGFVFPGILPVSAAISLQMIGIGKAMIVSCLTLFFLGFVLVAKQPSYLPKWSLPLEGSLKSIHLVLPHPDHPSTALRKWRHKNFSNAEAFQEDIKSSQKASLGFVGTVILLISLFVGISRFPSPEILKNDQRWLIPTLFLVSVGGLRVCIPFFIGYVHLCLLLNVIPLLFRRRDPHTP